MKRCTKCEVEKSLDQFHYDRASRDGLRHQCKTCKLIYYKKWYHHRKKAGIGRNHHSRHIKHRYNLNEIEYDHLYRVQEGKCAICKVPQLELTRRLSVDHVHGTNIIRGLLCGSCNTALGLFKESPIVLRKAANYVETWEQEQDVKVQSSILSFPRTAC